jgi:hypothetical protein
MGSANSERDEALAGSSRSVLVYHFCQLYPHAASLSVVASHAQVHAKAPSELPSARARMW